MSANTTRDVTKNTGRAAKRLPRKHAAPLQLTNVACGSAGQIAGCAIDRARAGRERTYPPQLHATRGRAGCIALKERDPKAVAALREKGVRTASGKARITGG